MDREAARRGASNPGTGRRNYWGARERALDHLGAFGGSRGRRPGSGGCVARYWDRTGKRRLSAETSDQLPAHEHTHTPKASRSAQHSWIYYTAVFVQCDDVTNQTDIE